MPRRNEKPTHIGFKSQEGDRGLQEGDRSLGWDGGAGDILLRGGVRDRKSTRLNSSHSQISYAVFCLKIKVELDVALGGVNELELVRGVREELPRLISRDLASLPAAAFPQLAPDSLLRPFEMPLPEPL